MFVIRLNLVFIATVFCCAQTFAPVAFAQTSLERMRQINPNIRDPIAIDENLIAANGIRKLAGKYVSIYTDVRNRPDIEELPRVFDEAVPQWCEYFGVELNRVQGWHVRAMIMADDQRFRAAKLFEGLPKFEAGLQQGHEMWVYLQPGKYYTRHLLLHEGTHAFMRWFLGGLGAPWYTEGMAEMIGVHSWNNDQLKINFRLTDRRQAEYWGRIKLIHDDRTKKQSLSIDDILAIPTSAFREVRYYAWSWAACEFFSAHPTTKTIFARLQENASQNHAEFNRWFEKQIRPVKAQLNRDWELYIDEIDFGFEIARAAIREIKTKSNNQFELDTKSGWQTTPFRVAPGDSIQIACEGRFIVANKNDSPWPCESNGISIEYYRGRPLGQLLIGTINANNIDGLIEPVSLPSDGNITIDKEGLLCFRINESPAKLNDNSGKLEIHVNKTSN